MTEATTMARVARGTFMARLPDGGARQPHAEPFQAEPVQTEPLQEEPVQAEPFQARPVQSAPFQAAPFHSPPFQALPFREKPFQSPPFHAEPFHARPSGGGWFQAVPGHRLVFHVSTGRVGDTETVAPGETGVRLAADWLKFIGPEVAAA
jgi:hypothetical protein